MVLLLSITNCWLSTSEAFAESKRLESVRRHEPKMSYLDNGVIKVGVDFNLGGSITYLSKSGVEQNMINSWDFGRQVQMSYFSGPVPFEVGEKKPLSVWKHIGWNPIQAGDTFGNAAKVLVATNDGQQIYTKCVPLQWPLDRVPGECTFETWLELDGNVVRMKCRFNNNRTDRTQWPARAQELPAIYTNAPWHRLITYTDDAPYTDGALTEIESPPAPSSFAWTAFRATEQWAALVDEKNFGLGVFSPGVVRYLGGFAGKPGKGGAHDNPTGYMTPNGHEILDWNITHEYRCDLIVGTLQQIRQHVYSEPRNPATPEWNFKRDRQGWWYINATDSNWPIHDELMVDLSRHNPQLVSPLSFWKAEDASALVIEAAAKLTYTHARIYWMGLADETMGSEKSVSFEIDGGEKYQIYRIPLAGVKGWEGAIVQMRIDPNLGANAGQAGDWIKIKSVKFEK